MSIVYSVDYKTISAKDCRHSTKYRRELIAILQTFDSEDCIRFLKCIQAIISRFWEMFCQYSVRYRVSFIDQQKLL